MDHPLTASFDPLVISLLGVLSYLLPVIAVLYVLDRIGSIAASLRRIATALEKNSQ